MATNAIARIQPKKQTLDDAYAPPANFLEIDLLNPETHGVGNKRYTDYELKMRVWKLPFIKLKQDIVENIYARWTAGSQWLK